MERELHVSNKGVLWGLMSPLLKNALGFLDEWHCWKWGQGWHLQIAAMSRTCDRLWGNIGKAKWENLKQVFLIDCGLFFLKLHPEVQILNSAERVGRCPSTKCNTSNCRLLQSDRNTQPLQSECSLIPHCGYRVTSSQVETVRKFSLRWSPNLARSSGTAPGSSLLGWVVTFAVSEHSRVSASIRVTLLSHIEELPLLWGLHKTVLR